MSIIGMQEKTGRGQEGICMRKRNVYKDIVCIAVGCLLLVLAVWAGDFWMRQQKSYEILIQSQSELTKGIVEELGKIEGLYGFTAVSSCDVKIRLEEYALEASLTGIDVSSYPLKWKSAREEISLGNTPILFFGQESFAAFTDSNGNGPGRSRIAEWVRDYQDLQLTVAGEDGRERSAKIGGIVETPSSGIYIGDKQMAALYGASARVSGGCARIQGYRNMQKAKELLSGAGFEAE